MLHGMAKEPAIRLLAEEFPSKTAITKIAGQVEAQRELMLIFQDAAPVAQLDRASGYEPEGREFESPRAHHSLFFALSKIRSNGFL
jgi:hypothetical protein